MKHGSPRSAFLFPASLYAILLHHARVPLVSPRLFSYRLTLIIFSTRAVLITLSLLERIVPNEHFPIRCKVAQSRTH